MINNIGICGVHRTGKTTLAKALAKELSMTFLPINTSKIFENSHLDPAEPMDFRTRLWIQQQILSYACNVWAIGDSFICDRTPIDMMAYTLAEVQGHTLDKELEFELAEYLWDCQSATQQYFGYLFLVSPAIPITKASGKASLSRGYIEHIHRLCIGFFNEEDLMLCGSRLPRSLTDLSDRVRFIADFVSARED